MIVKFNDWLIFLSVIKSFKLKMKLSILLLLTSAVVNAVKLDVAVVAESDEKNKLRPSVVDDKE